MSDFLNELKEKLLLALILSQLPKWRQLSKFIRIYWRNRVFRHDFDFKWADLDVKSGSEWFYRIDWSWNDLRTLIFKQQEAMQEAGWSANLLKIMINLERQRNI